MEVEATWWDSDGSKPAEQRIAPEHLSEAALRETLAQVVLMETPVHYYASYRDSTWARLSKKSDFELKARSFKNEGRLVNGVARLNLYSAYHIESPAEADALDSVFKAWELFAHQWPAFSTKLRLEPRDGEIAVEISCVPHPRRPEIDEISAQAAFSELMAESKQCVVLRDWLRRYCRRRPKGRQRSGLVVSQDCWFGADAPTATWYAAQYRTSTG